MAVRSAPVCTDEHWFWLMREIASVISSADNEGSAVLIFLRSGRSEKAPSGTSMVGGCVGCECGAGTGRVRVAGTMAAT